MLHYYFSSSHNLHELELSNEIQSKRFLPHLERFSSSHAQGSVVYMSGCDLHARDLVRKYFLPPDFQPKFLDLLPFAVADKPQLLMLGMDEFRIGPVVRMIRYLKSRPDLCEVPIILFCRHSLSAEDTDRLLAAGVIDYFNLSKEPGELVVQMKAAALHLQLLNLHKERLRQLQRERDRIVHHFEHLRGEIDHKKRESLVHLELFMRSKRINESLVDRMHDLRPYLNPQGKSRLSFLARQMKWELDEEEALSLQRRHDESHTVLYHYLEDRNAGLTKYEMRLCAYLKTNHTASNIARITLKSANCINVAFARIRTKLGVSSNSELKTLLASVD